MVLDIIDLRTSTVIYFIGSILGLSETNRRFDNDDMKVAFTLYALSMQ